MNQKKIDLAKVLDAMHEWCNTYNEPYVTACILTKEDGRRPGMAWNEHGGGYVCVAVDDYRVGLGEALYTREDK